MSDPNSRHQLWSKWTVVIRPSLPVRPALSEFKLNTERFLRSTGKFQSGTQIKITEEPTRYTLELLVDTDLHPHDAETRAYYEQAFQKFYALGLGALTTVTLKTDLMAGERLDGKPPDQLLIVPPFSIPLGSTKPS